VGIQVALLDCNAGANVVDEFKIEDSGGVHWQYSITRGDSTARRSGVVTATFGPALTAAYAEAGPAEVGDTSGAVLTVARSGDVVQLILTGSASGWDINCIRSNF
jgi:hypothetical protein